MSQWRQLPHDFPKCQKV
ncbi:hypothetical protein EQG59_15855 [Lactiplantibacillus plantarum]|nr:hypothetical protein EQJ27_15830 [Lactiplantibacillus plantarum]QAR39492.1 hypothetical protein EQJ27_16165 [Lactiplantibacillus plantarum]QBA78833.1 hypothetical protein EVE91_15535 [Lactiplantibacillus plantarum]RWZ05161.1 hypothetical protein EQG51_15620 [Lactiplantibacillus plantarum]RWZ31424.1 hypothetical protein EQG59_15855 [Lactiplantibacillus plantarum]